MKSQNGLDSFGVAEKILGTTGPFVTVCMVSNVKQMILDAHTRMTEDSTDTMIEAVSEYIRSKIKSAERHKGIYSEALKRSPWITTLTYYHPSLVYF